MKADMDTGADIYGLRRLINEPTRITDKSCLLCLTMKHSHCLKPLSVLDDENLTWENHVDAISKKIASDIGAVKRFNHCLPLPPCMLSSCVGNWGEFQI